MSDKQMKIDWFTNNKKPIYTAFMIASIIAFILAIILLINQFNHATGLRKITMVPMPLVFAYFTYSYYTKIKALKQND